LKKLIDSFLLFTVIFTVVTLVSSSWQLLNGATSDTNGHILIRAIFTFIGVCFYGIFRYLNIKNTWLKFFVQYLASIICIFLTVWSIGFIGELSKNAYRDAFLNWTFIFLSVVIVQFIIKSLRNIKRSSSPNET
jgi:hypothetical protein